MSRAEPRLDVKPMSAGASAKLALGAPWRLICSCGRSPEYLAPLEAVAVTRVLERRCASLLQHAEDLGAGRGGKPGRSSAMEPAAQVSIALGAANVGLRNLLGEETLEPGPLLTGGAEVTPATQRRAASQALASLTENVRCLIATIEAATTQDWDGARPDNGPTAAEMVGVALHDATHRLENAELALDAELAGSSVGWAAADAQPANFPSRQAML